MNVLASFFRVVYSARVRREVKTSFGEFPPKKVCSLLDHSAVPWFAMMALISLGIAFGELKFL
jgi:hypothetical protein